MSELLPNLIRFGRLLRGRGVAVTTDQLVETVDAWRTIDLRRRTDARDAARAILVSRREHLRLFDEAFDLFWSEHALRRGRAIDLGRRFRRSLKRQEQIFVSSEPATGEPEVESESPMIEKRSTWSAREVLRRKDFADLTEDEERAVREMIARRPLHLPPRRTRRRESASRGPYLDPRAMLRRSLRDGGEIMNPQWRRRRVKRRPLVVLCDISGSMEVYSRLLLQFLYTLRSATDDLEDFAFGTRLTRITRELESRRPSIALRDAADAIVDWGGGTRIGESLHAFHRDWGRRVLRRGAVVMVISDGWDRGEVDLLEREVIRLKRRCRRLLWLNPLLGSEGYEPLTRGIQAVLPWADEFLPVHNLESLEALADLLEKDRSA